MIGKIVLLLFLFATALAKRTAFQSEDGAIALDIAEVASTGCTAKSCGAGKACYRSTKDMTKTFCADSCSDCTVVSLLEEEGRAADDGQDALKKDQGASTGCTAKSCGAGKACYRSTKDMTKTFCADSCSDCTVVS